MAKRGRPRKKSLKVLLKKPELWIGVFTVGLFIGLVGGVIIKNQSDLELGGRKELFVSPVPDEIETTPSLSETKPTLSVQKLAYTSSSFEVVVLANDSYWKIAKRVCGDAKKNFLTIQELNENIRLYRGMTVKVACE